MDDINPIFLVVAGLAVLFFIVVFFMKKMYPNPYAEMDAKKAKKAESLKGTE